MTQSELREYILTFADAEEYNPFDDTGPIYRHKSNGKWFGFFAELSGKICVILKCEPLEADFLRQAYQGVTPGWHMNKQHWNTVELSSDVPPEEIKNMVRTSFHLTAPKIRGNTVDNYRDVIGKTVDVVVDRPLGTYHPKTDAIFYTVNYGCVLNVIAGDGSPQDVYILGVDKPLKTFRGTVIAVIHRLNDVEDKWVAAPEGMTFTKEEIIAETRFVEQFFQIEVYC